MNPRQELIDRVLYELGSEPRDYGRVKAERLAARVVDAVLAVLQQDKTTEDRVVSAEGSPAADPVSEPGVHAAVSWTYDRAHADLSLLRIRRELKEPRGWWTANDEADFEAVLADIRAGLAAAGSLAAPSESGGQNQESSESSGVVSASEAPAVDPVSERERVCPWCSERVRVKDGRMVEHVPRYTWAGRPCPCSRLTPEAAQDKTDEAIMRHVATGE